MLGVLRFVCLSALAVLAGEPGRHEQKKDRRDPPNHDSPARGSTAFGADAPVAIIEDVEAPSTKLQLMDYLDQGQSFVLKPADVSTMKFVPTKSTILLAEFFFS